MENTSQLQCEQDKQEGLTARLSSKSPSAQGKGQHAVALFLEQRKDPVFTKSSSLSKKVITDHLRSFAPALACSCCQWLSQKTQANFCLHPCLKVSLLQFHQFWSGEVGNNNKKTDSEMWHPETGEGRMKFYFLLHTYDIVLTFTLWSQPQASPSYFVLLTIKAGPSSNRVIRINDRPELW